MCHKIFPSYDLDFDIIKTLLITKKKKVVSIQLYLQVFLQRQWEFPLS